MQHRTVTLSVHYKAVLDSRTYGSKLYLGQRAVVRIDGELSG